MGKVILYPRIIGRMAELGITQTQLAVRIDVSPAKISRLLAGLGEWSLREAIRTLKELRIDASEINVYFARDFTPDGNPAMKGKRPGS